MRKLTIDFMPNEQDRKAMEPMFQLIHSYEILETLKIEWEEGICIDLIECRMKEPHVLHDSDTLGQYEVLRVLKTEGDKQVCLVKHHQPEETMDEFQEFDLDLIYTQPTVIAEDKFTTSVIGDRENLTRFVEVMRKTGVEILEMTFKRSMYHRQDILSVLTDRQREIIIAAHRFGYYDYPRKVNSKRLSERVDISVPTLVQHLRKAEGRIMAELLAGYS
jgi:hypothetical protein